MPKAVGESPSMRIFLAVSKTKALFILKDSDELRYFGKEETEETGKENMEEGLRPLI
jgi:hypothetical protein